LLGNSKPFDNTKFGQHKTCLKHKSGFTSPKGVEKSPDILKVLGLRIFQWFDFLKICRNVNFEQEISSMVVKLAAENLTSSFMMLDRTEALWSRVTF
jgi:hypothetical protein